MKKGNSYVQQMPEMRKEADRPRDIKRGYGPECWGRIPGIHISETEEDEQIDGQMSIFDVLDEPPEKE